MVYEKLNYINCCNTRKNNYPLYYKLFRIVQVYTILKYKLNHILTLLIYNNNNINNMDSCIKDIQQLKYQFTHFEILITYLLLETNI